MLFILTVSCTVPRWLTIQAILVARARCRNVAMDLCEASRRASSPIHGSVLRGGNTLMMAPPGSDSIRRREVTIVGIATIKVRGAPPEDTGGVLPSFVHIAGGDRHLQTLPVVTLPLADHRQRQR